MGVSAAAVAPLSAQEPETTLRVNVIREDGEFAAEFTSGDGKVGGMGDYSPTPVGALANLCATLIKIDEDDAKERLAAPSVPPATTDNVTRTPSDTDASA